MGLFDKFFSLFKRKKDKEPPSEDKEETKSEESKEETPSVIIEDKAPEPEPDPEPEEESVLPSAYPFVMKCLIAAAVSEPKAVARSELLFR